MGCCGQGNKAPVSQAVSINGQVVHTAASLAEARIWIALNAKGARATVRAVAAKKA